MSATPTVEAPAWPPNVCPTWCDRGHAEALAEGCTWEEAQEHFGGGYDEVLDEICNAVDHRVTRTGGGAWALDLRQRIDSNSHYLTSPTVRLEVSQLEPHARLSLNLTSGEARTLARQLEAMADRLDLA